MSFVCLSPPWFLPSLLSLYMHNFKWLSQLSTAFADLWLCIYRFWCFPLSILESVVCSPLFLSSMPSLSFWRSPFIPPGRDGTLTYQALPIWSIQVDCHQVALTKIILSNLYVHVSVCLLWWLVGCWVEVPVTSGSVCHQLFLGPFIDTYATAAILYH